MDIERIYFDLDDTLADFAAGLVEICNIEPVAQDCSSKEQDDKMWEAVKNADHFYSKLKECLPGMELYKKFHSVYGKKVEFLSAVPKPKRGITCAEEDKRLWVKKHLGEDVVVNITHSAEEKKEFCRGRGYILVDDLRKNIEAWRNEGGTGIWFLKDDPEATAKEVVQVDK